MSTAPPQAASSSAETRSNTISMLIHGCVAYMGGELTGAAKAAAGMRASMHTAKGVMLASVGANAGAVASMPMAAPEER